LKVICLSLYSSSFVCAFFKKAFKAGTNILLRRRKRVDASKQRTLLVVLITLLLIVTSFLMLSRPDSIVKNASAVESVGVGVYWDGNCTKPVTLIDWGTLYPGSTKSVGVYLSNEDANAILRSLLVRTENWSSSEASENMQLSLNCSNETIQPGQNVRAYFQLHVSDKITGVTTFTFSIVVGASQYYEGDVDHSGQVGPLDLALFSRAYNSTSTDPSWNPDADFDWSGKIDMHDFSLLESNYGKSG
jgi:hypothetical protein